MEQLHDLRVSRIIRLASPRALKEMLPVGEKVAATVTAGRREVENILTGKDSRMLVIVGPCSIHDMDAAREYASKLSVLRTELQHDLCIMMRVYFEKPRTTIGWKGFINDPHLDDTYDIEHGLFHARKLLLEINEMGLLAATEFLDPISPQYVADLVSWAAIGARTIESQTHRQMASGLSMPVGFKNSTDGRLNVAVDAIRSAMHPHSFLGIDQEKVAIQIADQIVEWKQTGKLKGAVNASAVELAQAPGVRSYLTLAEKLGATLAQMAPDQANKMTVRTSGEFLHTFNEVITAAALKGFLDVRQSKDTNYINAFTMAKECGISLEQKFEKENPDYTNLIRIELENGTTKRMIGGTIFGEKEIRIVMIDQFLVEFKPEGNIIIYNNTDKPGVIANVTQLLLLHNLNVAYVALSRDEEKNMAMTAIVVDGEVTPVLLDEVRNVNGVDVANLVSL